MGTVYLLLFRMGPTTTVEVTEVNAILTGPTGRLTLYGGYQRTLELSGPTSGTITVEG